MVRKQFKKPVVEKSTKINVDTLLLQQKTDRVVAKANELKKELTELSFLSKYMCE